VRSTVAGDVLGNRAAILRSKNFFETGAIAVPARRHSVGPSSAHWCVSPRAVTYPEKSFPDNVAGLGKVWRNCPLPGDQVVCLGHDQAAWSGPAINQLGVVNPWQLPPQKPHPPIWAAGISSPETIRWAARQRITYLVLGSGPAGR
jgi:hypothetical protein